MKLILDTNILVSALIFSGIAADIFDEAVRYHYVFLTENILNEFSNTLQSKLKVPKSDTLRYSKHLRSGFTVVSPDNPMPEVCRDKKDNHLLQLSEFVSANYLITGDKDLLVLDQFGITSIVDMRTYRSKNPKFQ